MDTNHSADLSVDCSLPADRTLQDHHTSVCETPRDTTRPVDPAAGCRSALGSVFVLAVNVRHLYWSTAHFHSLHIPLLLARLSWWRCWQRDLRIYSSRQMVAAPVNPHCRRLQKHAILGSALLVLTSKWCNERVVSSRPTVATTFEGRAVQQCYSFVVIHHR